MRNHIIIRTLQNLLVLFIFFVFLSSISFAEIMGDINGDGQINLRDAITTLQVTVGLSPPGNIFPFYDVDKNQKVDLREAIYIMQTLAGLRPIMIVPNAGETIYTGTINSANTSTSIVIPGKIAITIPAGIVPTGTTLTIAEVNSSKIVQDQDYFFNKIYNVALSSGDNFSEPLEITINYDQSTMPSGQQFNTTGASYFNPGLNRWIPFHDVIVDQINGKVSFKTNHLTQLSVWTRQFLYGYTDFLSSDHFNVYWQAGEPMSNVDYQSPFTSHTNNIAPYYAQDLLTYLEDSYSAFSNRGLYVPTHVKVDVYIRDLGQTAGNTSFLGYLEINKKMDRARDISGELQSTAAHEFFHYVQDYYFAYLFSDYTNRWWLEATAVQADRLVWINKAFYEADDSANENINYVLAKSWDDCNSDPYFYTAGGFLSYLANYRVGQKVNIVELIIATGKKLTTSFYFRTIIDDYLSKNLLGWKGIGREYADYVQWSFEGKGAIYIPVSSNAGYDWTKLISFSSSGSQRYSVTIPHMASTILKIRNSSKASGQITITGIALPADVRNFLYSSNSSGPVGPVKTDIMIGDSASLAVLPYPSEWKEFLLVNTSKDYDRTVDITVDFISDQKTTLSISPASFNGSINREYSFVADSNGTAPDIYKIIWDFGDQTANLTVDNSGNVKHIFAAKGTYSINAKMLDQSNNQIASASATAIISADPTNFDIWLNITGVRFELYIPDVLYSNGDNPIGSRFIRDTTTTWGIPFNTKDGPVVNGTTFIFTGKGAWDLSESVTQADSTTTITASVNQDASVLLSFKYEAVKTILYSQGDITSEVYKEVFELQNVPIHLTTVSRLSYEPPYLADVSPYVKNVMVENKTTYINDTNRIRSITSVNFKGSGTLDISFTYK